MSDEPDTDDADAGENGENAEGADEEGIEPLQERTEELRERLESAETESDLDGIESELEAIEADLEPLVEAEEEEAEEGDDEDEEEGPATTLAGDLETLGADLEESRGPYAEDVVRELDEAIEEVAETRWTERGEGELETAVETYVAEVEELLTGEESVEEIEDAETLETVERLTAQLEEVGSAIEAADLDPDEDGETIAGLVDATEELRAAIEDAQTWDDLSVREQLDAQGYYDVLAHNKDYPPEWGALKVHEKQGNVEMVLLALETFESDFMEEHALEALERMGDEAALETMAGRAEKRNRPAIRILGKIGVADEDVVETLLEYVDADSDPLLQKATFRALGEMGSEAAVQPLANKLLTDDPDTRSRAARALGLIGDTRTIDPLADVVADDEEDTVRASAAWALNRIGTEEALDALGEYDDDRSYLVQSEAERAAQV